MQPYEQNQYAAGTGFARSAAQVDQGLRTFMLGVYNNMVLGLAISALVALGREHAGRHQRSVRWPSPASAALA